VHRAPRLIVMRAAAGSDDFAVYRSLDLPTNARLQFDK